MLINLTPLKHRDYRLLYFGQFVSTFGSMMTYVALPYQLYHLTNSSLAVGLIGVAQLVPILLTALVGGAYADAFDKRSVLLTVETLLALSTLGLAINAFVAEPSVALIYIFAALSAGFAGFHGPSKNAMTPRLVPKEEIPFTGPLKSVAATTAQIAGPATAGLLIASFGLKYAFVVDVATFGISFLCVALMRPMPPSGLAVKPSTNSIKEGLAYARSRQELLGTYITDFVAVVFGMPMALFPAVAENFGGARAVGWLYSAPAIGALVFSLFSGWTARVSRHGRAIIFSALIWGLAIIAFGFAPNLYLAVACLALAGGADMASGVFRNTVWNTTIPDHLRGRLAGIEMISYMSGPLLGNAESGLVASLVSTQFSILSGGVLCVVGVAAVAVFMRKFWKYEILT